MFTPIETKDGSSTFYSEAFGEWFHSREGACNEAQRTYVEASNLAERARSEKLNILDVCYGLGYNTAAALETIWQVNPTCRIALEALEIDIEVARSAIAQNLTQTYSTQVQAALQQMAIAGKILPAEDHALTAHLRLGDARQTIQALVKTGWQADVIFLDPFSPQHCPQLWSIEFLQQVTQCLNPHNGVIVTYSCAAAVRSALQMAGLSIGATRAGGRKWPGTIAKISGHGRHNLPPLSTQEQEHMQTRAAVPYRDPSLQGTAKSILARRQQEQSTSQLLPTAPWRRRWQARQQSQKSQQQ